MSFEIFVPIKGFEDYSVSNYGRVKSYKKDKVDGKIIKGSFDKNGYKRFELSGKVKGVHRLVGEAFLEDWNEDLMIDHKDGNKEKSTIFPSKAVINKTIIYQT